MKCSNCGNEMIESRTGWLCVSCGHAQLAGAMDVPVLPKIIHERARARIPDPGAPAPNQLPGSPGAAPLAAPAAAPPPPVPAAPQPVLEPQPVSAVSPAPTATPDSTAIPPVPPPLTAPLPPAVTAATPPANNSAPAPVVAPPVPIPDEAEPDVLPVEAVVEKDDAQLPKDEPVQLPSIPEPTVAPPAPDALLTPQTALSSSPAVSAALEGISAMPQPKSQADVLELTDVASVPKTPHLKLFNFSHKPKAHTDAPVAKPESAPEEEPDQLSPKVASAKSVWDTPAAQAAAPVMNTTKPPLQPQTHPKPLSRKRHILNWTLTVLFVLMAAGAAYLLGSGQNPLKFFTGSIGRVESMSTVSSAATPTPAASPETAPITDVAAANLERQSALGAYAAAYRATAVNGFYSTVPPKISVTNTDPATAMPYEISTAIPVAIGQIRYWPGGNCTGAPHIPGSIGTKYLAVQIKLDGSPDIYCLQVN